MCIKVVTWNNVYAKWESNVGHGMILNYGQIISNEKVSQVGVGEGVHAEESELETGHLRCCHESIPIRVLPKCCASASARQFSAELSFAEDRVNSHDGELRPLLCCLSRFKF